MNANLFAQIPNQLANEFCNTLVQGQHVRIERIVSRGHTAPEHGWYDQDEHEWVLVVHGSGTITYDNHTSTTLHAGDHVVIPARTKHRVSWTDPNCDTLWLAVFYA